MEQDNREAAPAAMNVNADVLDSILSFVPLVDLATAMQVSKEWKLAVSSSLLYLNPPKPWFFFHQQSFGLPDRNSSGNRICSRDYNTISTRAYDSRSRTWMQIHRPVPSHASGHILRSSQSGFLYILSPSTLSFSSDPFHLKWHHANEAPLIRRTDPIVALVGGKVIIAGGGCEFDDTNPLAVEIYDVKTRSRKWGESMPETFKDSAASTWLSVATDGRILYVMERESGVMHTFDPESSAWSEPHCIRPDPDGFKYEITFTAGRLILTGIIGDLEGALGLKLWSVNPESLGIEEIGEMPNALFDKMKEDSFEISCIRSCSEGNWVYIYNPCEIGDVYICEMINGGCRWTVERIPMKKGGRSSWKPAAFTCSNVGIYDVDEAVKWVGIYGVDDEAVKSVAPIRGNR